MSVSRSLPTVGIWSRGIVDLWSRATGPLPTTKNTSFLTFQQQQKPHVPWSRLWSYSLRRPPPVPSHPWRCRWRRARRGCKLCCPPATRARRWPRCDRRSRPGAPRHNGRFRPASEASAKRTMEWRLGGGYNVRVLRKLRARLGELEQWPPVRNQGWPVSGKTKSYTRVS